MDVEMLVERVKVLCEARAPDAMRALLASPAVQTLATVALMLRMPIGEGAQHALVGEYLRGLAGRTADDVALIETEIDPEILYVLGEQEIQTIGELRRRTDDELLAIGQITGPRLEEARAIQRKYLRLGGSSAGVPLKLRRGEGPELLTKDERVERRILGLLEEGLEIKDVCRKLRVPYPKVRALAERGR